METLQLKNFPTPLLMAFHSASHFFRILNSGDRRLKNARKYSVPIALSLIAFHLSLCSQPKRIVSNFYCKISLSSRRLYPPAPSSTHTRPFADTMHLYELSPRLPTRPFNRVHLRLRHRVSHSFLAGNPRERIGVYQLANHIGSVCYITFRGGLATMQT